MQASQIAPCLSGLAVLSYSGVEKYSTTPTLPPTILLAKNHETRKYPLLP
jgi:hypothetical protein